MVRTVVRCLALLLACLAGCAAPLHQLPLNQPGRPPNVAAEAWSSTYLFTDGARLCSAVLVGPDVALTARHCVEDFRGGAVVHPDGRAHAVVEAAVAADEDIAFLRLVPASTTAAEVGVTQDGTSGYVLGYGCSGGAKLDARPVRFLRRVQTPDPTNLILDVWSGVACKGDSGGGVFVDGKLVGISVGIVPSDGLVLTVPAEFVRRLLER